MARHHASAGQGSGERVSPGLATILGAGAILLWATLATLTVLTGVIPPLRDHGDHFCDRWQRGGSWRRLRAGADA